jgi:hypothetical protein
MDCDSVRARRESYRAETYRLPMFSRAILASQSALESVRLEPGEKRRVCEYDVVYLQRSVRCSSLDLELHYSPWVRRCLELSSVKESLDYDEGCLKLAQVESESKVGSHNRHLRPRPL